MLWTFIAFATRSFKSSAKLVPADGAVPSAAFTHWERDSRCGSGLLRHRLPTGVTAVSPRYPDPCHERAAHSCTLDTSATAAAGAPVSQDPGTAVVFMLLTQDPRCAAVLRDSTPDEAPRRTPLGRTSSCGQKRRRRSQHTLLMKTPISLTTCRTSAVLATEDPYSLCRHWPQFRELGGDHAAVPSQDMLHPAQLVRSQPPAGKSLPQARAFREGWKK